MTTAEAGGEDPTAHLIANFVTQLGVTLDPRTIMTVYSVPRDLRTFVFRRQVAMGFSEVWKVQPLSRNEESEADNFNLLADDGYSGIVLPHAVSTPVDNNYEILRMPYLGHSLADLKQAMRSGQEIRLGRGEFHGFTEEEIIRLAEKLRSDHLRFADMHAKLHDDLGLQTEANNVTCRSLNGRIRLLLVDAAKLRPANEETIEHFHDQMDLIEEWMLESLLRFI